MKRRDFIFKGMILLTGLSATIKQAIAAVVWVKQGFMGYKDIAPPDKAKKEQECHTCLFFKDDKKVKDGGLCTQKQVSKGKVVYVKKEGTCSMWKTAKPVKKKA